VAMLSASISGCDAASGIGEFFDEKILIFIRWLAINFRDLVFFETLFDIMTYSHG
jgi:hypothetical protein